MVVVTNDLTRTSGPADGSEVLRVGDIALDVGAYLLWVGTSSRPVALKECRLLALLLANAGRVVTRESLYKTGWGTGPVPDNSLDVYMHRLRRRVESDAHHPARIRTVRGVGYIFDR